MTYCDVYTTLHKLSIHQVWALYNFFSSVGVSNGNYR